MATSVSEKTLSHTFVPSDRVEGTPVFQPGGKKIGRIERLMIEKVSGKVAYAVMSFGGFLGFGEDHYPLPWALLKYNTALEGYEVDLDQKSLKNAPRHDKDKDWDWGDRDEHIRIHEHYGARPIWY
ncbi:MAG: PRC-barrel domain-containing protein [Xanthobacteraceae bacterium]